MSDYGDLCRAIKERKQEVAKFKKPCPECQRLLPKAHPKMLLPGQRCKMHKYTDPRKRTRENSVFEPPENQHE